MICSETVGKSWDFAIDVHVQAFRSKISILNTIIEVWGEGVGPKIDTKVLFALI